MDSLFSLGFLESSQFFFLPFGVFLLMTLIFIPSMSLSSSPEAVGKAIACYMMKAFALLLMGVSGLLMTYNLMMRSLLPSSALVTLVLVFAVGLGTFVHFSRLITQIDSAAVAVPKAIFHHSCIVLGLIIAALAMLSLALMLLSSERLTALDGWQMPSSALLLGLLLAIGFSMNTPRGISFGKTRKK